MKPPKRIRIGHIDFTVTVDTALVAKYAEDPDADGCMSEKHSTIGLNPLPEPRTRTVLLHEVLHGCIAASGAEFSEANEERFVSMTTGPLLDALRSNPQLVAYLLAD